MAPLDLADLERNGFTVLRQAVSSDVVLKLRDELTRVYQARPTGRQVTQRVPYVRQLAAGQELLGLIRPAFSRSPRCVRSLFFDKRPDANWNVAWHQDLTVAVQERRSIPGFGPWSAKEGVPHSHAPAPILEQMITLRIHLDPCHLENGALEISPGSHRLGRIAWQSVPGREKSSVTAVECRPGDVLVMRPLLFHRSSSSCSAGHRRILHLEYADFELPGGLGWAEGDPGGNAK